MNHERGGLGNRLADDTEPDESISRSALCRKGQGRSTNKAVLVELDDPGQVGFERVRKGVGIDSGKQVLLFQAQEPLRLDAERNQPEVGSCTDNRFPDVQSIVTGNMNFVAQLADEANPQNNGG